MAIGTAAALQAAISSGSQNIALEPGDYGPFVLTDMRPAARLTIRSADPAQRATFARVSLAGCANLALEGVEVFFPHEIEANAAMALVGLDGCERIDITDCELHSHVPGTPLGGRGLSITGTDIRVSGCRVHHVAKGAVVLHASGVTLEGNDFDTLRSDTMQISTSRKCVIENNFGARTYHPQDGDHCDFIQFSGGDSSDVTIRGNVSLLQSIGNVQGIFLDDATFDRIEISDNVIATGMARGITINAGSDNIATFNTVIHIVGATRSKASIIGGAMRSEHNIYANWQKDPANVVVPLTHYAYSRLYQGVPDGGKLGLTIEDFRPVPGSLAETNGAYARIEELLSAPSPARP